MEGTLKCSANYVPLSPISFLERSAVVYADRAAVIYGDAVKYTWRETFQRCRRLASSLSLRGITPGDVVAALAPNVPAMYELHFGVPMAGAVLCTLNTRHNSALVSALLEHSEAKIIFVDYEYLDVTRGAFEILSKNGSRVPLLVLIPESTGPSTTTADAVSAAETPDYENFISKGKPDFTIGRPLDEWDPISLNYTSGTTSTPKGVVYSHRGAYLNSLAAVLSSEMRSMPVFLWTVPMFHCNGWCYTWGIAAQGGTNICLRNVTGRGIYEAIARHRVTHMGGAPTILSMIVNTPMSSRRQLPGKVTVVTGAAPPIPPVLLTMEEQGFDLIHGYGLTETYGPGTVCTWKPEWDLLPPRERAKLKALQGVHHLGIDKIDVKDVNSGISVPPDAMTMGEVMFRGNTVMNGYFKDMKATQEVFVGGWLHSGDLGVRHPNGYIEIKDRLKDIIISGGENISTIKVESVIFDHPAVLDAAVVGRPDDHWGETPCAFVKLKDGCGVSPKEMIDFCRDHLPHFMAPKTVVFVEVLPKTSTGKTQKFVLKEKAKAMGSLPSASSKL